MRYKYLIIRKDESNERMLLLRLRLLVVLSGYGLPDTLRIHEKVKKVPTGIQYRTAIGNRNNTCTVRAFTNCVSQRFAYA